MGTILSVCMPSSFVWGWKRNYRYVRFFIGQIRSLERTYSALLKRLQQSPGLPVSQPTASFWHDDPSPIADYIPPNGRFPQYSDVVILGSGITGTSVARVLVDSSKGLKVTMLEARAACSGATGRNGGHIKPPLHHDYLSLKKKYGKEQAMMLIRFRLQHISELLSVAAEEDAIKESQCREVESLDVYFDRHLFDQAKKQLLGWKADMPVESQNFSWEEGEEAAQKFHLAKQVAGVIYNQAGAVHPYRLVTSILKRLLEDHPEEFNLSTHTPCTSISEPTTENPFYLVHTSRGTIATPHVVHATNAWASHLLEPMRTKIFPARGNMSAQRPGILLSPSTLDGMRSWVFYDHHLGYDYLTQLPNGENELMFGGGFFQGTSGADEDEDGGLGELGNVRDDEYNVGVAAHLAGSLPILFGETNWGAERIPASLSGFQMDAVNHNKPWFAGRVKALWSGILGISADGLPWVGSLPPKVSGRCRPPIHSIPKSSVDVIKNGDERSQCNVAASRTAGPAEWIAAGYSGEGMAHAYMSGKALGYMILGLEEDDDVKMRDWFPDIMRVSEKRWKKANVEDLLEHLGDNGEG